MKELNEIPKEHLIEMLKGAAWYSGERPEFGDTQGYSFEVQEETCHRDVFYQGIKLFKSPEEALLEYWRKFYKLPGEIISKPGAAIEVRMSPLPERIAKGISDNLQRGRRS